MRPRFKDIDAICVTYRAKLNEALELARTKSDADPTFLDAQMQTIDLRVQMMRTQMELINNGVSASDAVSAVMLALGTTLTPCWGQIGLEFLENPPESLNTANYIRYGSAEHAMVHVMVDMFGNSLHSSLNNNIAFSRGDDIEADGVTAVSMEVDLHQVN